MKRGVLLGLLGGAAVLGLAGYAVSRRPSSQEDLEKYAATCELDENLPKEMKDLARFLMLNMARGVVSVPDALRTADELERAGYKKTAACVRTLADRIKNRG